MTSDEYEEAVERRTMELTAKGVMEMLQEGMDSKRPNALRDILGEICLTPDELKERLDDWRADAEQEIQDENPKPCCKDFHCPCGG